MPKHHRLHIVGSTPRSGTTLTFELITACFEIAPFGAHEISLFIRPARINGPYCSKMPTDLVHAARLLPWDPGLHVLYTLRDPRDAVVSRHGTHPDRYWCDFPIWRRNQRLFAKLGDHPRAMRIRYEDLVTDPDAAQAAIAARFPFLRTVHVFSAYEKVSRPSQDALHALGGVRRISTGSIGSWRQNKPRLAQQIKENPDLPAAVIAAGYEADDSWLAELGGVIPDGGKSVRTEAREATRGAGPLYAVQRLSRRLGSLGDEARYVLGLGPRL
jgi:hypothetical protein